MVDRIAVPINYIELVDGDPKIAGTRLHVAFIGNMIVRLGESIDWVLENYPFLTLSQIHAALAYYYDHQEALDAWLDQPISEELLEESRKRREELKARYERMQAEKAQSAANDNEGQT